MAPAGYGSRVEGLHAVAAAVAAGRVRELVIEHARSKRPAIRAILDQVGTSHVTLVDDLGDKATTDAPQGILAKCDPIAPVSLESLAGDETAILVLDHLEDPHNVGAIARSAAAAGVAGLVVSSRRAAPLSAASFKSAAGALERLPVAVVGSIPDALKRLKDMGVWAVGLDSEGDQSLFGLPLLTEPVAVVVGAEGEGLSHLASQRCDVVVSIPMIDISESLNASVSGALAAFEIMRVRSTKSGEG
jgi:23S rRNA (guanosine2251-2'-O)-methyltransferase